MLVITSNWHPISYRFGVIGAYCANFVHFVFSSPLYVLCSSWAHWKARSGLPVSVNWTFSPGVTAEALCENTLCLKKTSPMFLAITRDEEKLQF